MLLLAHQLGHTVSEPSSPPDPGGGHYDTQGALLIIGTGASLLLAVLFG